MRVARESGREPTFLLPPPLARRKTPGAIQFVQGRLAESAQGGSFASLEAGRGGRGFFAWTWNVFARPPSGGPVRKGWKALMSGGKSAGSASFADRSGERRGGEEGRSRGGPYH